MDLIPADQVQVDGPPQIPDSEVIPDRAPGAIPADQVKLDNPGQYETTEQQVKTGLEGAAQGVAGPLATYAETKFLGVKPEDIRGRAEANPWIHGGAEAAGFAGSMFAGVGEAAALAKAGELAAHAAQLGEAASIGQKLAKGAVTAATEMGLYQAGDEASKAILQDPNQTMGSVAANVGLSAVLGGVTGPVFTGAGLALRKGLGSPEVKNFVDTLAKGRADVSPGESITHELTNVMGGLKDMGTEIGGVHGMRSEAMGKLMPEMHDGIAEQATDLLTKMRERVSDLREIGDTPGMVNRLDRQANALEESFNTNDPKAIYDMLNDTKRHLGEWASFERQNPGIEQKGFINASKELGHEFKTALEDVGVWGKAGSLQKELNAAYHEVLPFQKIIDKKFTEFVGNDRIVSPQKVETYLNTNGRANNPTIRQQNMGGLTKGVEKFQSAVQSVFDAAGVENPFQPIGMSALQESLEVPSMGAKLAKFWQDKLGPQSLGSAAGAATGEAIAPGFGGAYIGKEVLGPVFTAMIKPLLDKYPNIDVGAFRQAMALGKSIQEGNKSLSNAAINVFTSGAKTIPSHLMPDKKSLEKLDHRTSQLNQNINGMANVPGKVGYYLPGHGTAMATTTGNAVSYINAQRPAPVKMYAMDREQKPSPEQQAKFNRTLEVAQQPLVVLQHIKDGTLLPQDVATIKAVYPEYYQKMSQELLSKLASHTAQDGSVPFRVRQSLSLFLGTPLDSTMTPQAIQAAQAVFMVQQPEPQAPKMTGAQMGKVAQNHMTGDQARQERQNKV